MHEYKEDKQSIESVLEEVAELFCGHPDLLKEFAFFLPEAVQAQASARLLEAASKKPSAWRRSNLLEKCANRLAEETRRRVLQEQQDRDRRREEEARRERAPAPAPCNHRWISNLCLQGAYPSMFTCLPDRCQDCGAPR